MRLILPILFLFTVNIFEQIINFPDSNFKATLRNHNPPVDTNGDGEIQVSEANLFMGNLNLYNRGIQDMTGIEYFTNIDYLECSFNDFTEIDVSQNILLERLNANSTGLIYLDISNHPSLKDLSLWNCQLNFIDISFAPVEYLNLSNNYLSSIEVSSDNELKYLKLNSNSFSDLDLTQFPYLESLGLDSNNITEIDVSQNLALQYLFIGNNNISEIDITNNSNLKVLLAYYNNLTNLNLSQNNLLEDVYINDNLLTELDITSSALEILDCSNNEIINVQLAIGGGPSRQWLYLNDNLFSELDLSDTKVRNLFCRNNPNLEYINMRNGYNWGLKTSQSRLENLPLLSEVCIDNPGSSTELMDWVEN